MSKRKIVFTNGCFDIIHSGHIKLLKEAKSYGDYLIVGLNSDASVRRLKGLGRPINSEQDRKIVVESIKYVDEVIIFDQDTPEELIKIIKPDVLVKGSDWVGKKVAGSDFVSELYFVELLHGRSTTEIIKKIKE